jgi:UDP-N-acetylmuramate dehydrogenase
LQSLSQLHTFGFDAQAPFVIEFNAIQQIMAHQCHQDAFVILGEGSNTVFTEDYYGEVWINKLHGMVFSEDTTNHYITVASGENWHSLVTTCVEQGIGGFENLALIPGTVGAAPIQNIGAYGVEVGTYIDSVEYIDLATRTVQSIAGSDCAFGYRDSIFKHALKDKVFITTVNFTIPKLLAPVTSYGELATLVQPSISDIYDKVIQIRQQKLPDPKQIGNAGSFFKNPVISKQHFTRLQARFPAIPSFPVSDDLVKVPAGWLIDTLGFKGKIIDGIQCHPQQALVLTNIASGTGTALITFARQIIAEVSTQYGITLEHEVQLLGRINRITL